MSALPLLPTLPVEDPVKEAEKARKDDERRVIVAQKESGAGGVCDKGKTTRAEKAKDGATVPSECIGVTEEEGPSIEPMGQAVSPIPESEDLQSESATPLFKELGSMIANVDKPRVDDPELEKAVKSILPKEKDTPTMYIPNCDTTGTQSSPQKDDVEEDRPEISPELPPLTCEERSLRKSPKAKPEAPVQECMATISSASNIEPAAGKQRRPSNGVPSRISKDVRYRETHCRHGILRPIHVHIKTDVTEPNGRRKRSNEIQVNCALCPPPVVKKVVEVQGFPKNLKTDTTSFSSMTSSSESEVDQ